MAIGNRPVWLCLNWLDVSNHKWVSHLEWTFADAISTHSTIVRSNGNYCSHEILDH